jgi:hypothetical protein
MLWFGYGGGVNTGLIQQKTPPPVGQWGFEIRQTIKTQLPRRSGARS